MQSGVPPAGWRGSSTLFIYFIHFGIYIISHSLPFSPFPSFPPLYSLQGGELEAFSAKVLRDACDKEPNVQSAWGQVAVTHSMSDKASGNNRKSSIYGIISGQEIRD